MAQSEAQIDEMNQQIAGLEGQLNTERNKNEQLQGILRDTQGRVHDAESHQSQLLEQLTSVKGEKSKVQGDTATLEADLRALQQQDADLRAKLEVADAKIGDLQAEIESLVNDLLYISND